MVLGQASVGPAWLEEAALRVPPIDRDTSELLGRLISLSGLAVAPGIPRAAGPLLRLFRIAAGTAVASGCHLALLSLDLERLRGGLIVRSVFRAASAEAA